MHTSQETIRIYFWVTWGFVKPFLPSPGEGGGERKKRQHQDHQRHSRTTSGTPGGIGSTRTTTTSITPGGSGSTGTTSGTPGSRRRYQDVMSNDGGVSTQAIIDGPGGRTTWDPAMLWGERGLGRYLGLVINLIFPTRRAGAGEAAP
ncbi:hypothetical protein NDU88_004897 [Pleurodeles waltl]|uniref:Uncharacterized protein n=1 Tax=Pleurodeles waltl TaxID=8319 RepID=A0AAV7M8F4_PLEWA|nr:hypothetical protein NDU88_004897 [Pleurodeles waltl]